MNYKLKQLLLVFCCLHLCCNILYAQNEDNKWVIGGGFNIVDIRTPSTLKGVLEDYLNGSIEDLNMNGAFFRVFAGRHLKKGFSIQLAASSNKIKKGYAYSSSLPEIDNDFFTIDTKLKYDLNYIFGETKWFDPFILGGMGYSSIGKNSAVSLSAGYGFNIWISDTVGLNFQSDYNHHLKLNANDFFQHSAGVIFKINSRKRFNWNKNF
ncbi:Outer membrane protein beta-barrel domain-containing protein [Lutibacter oricola]|uniref:Outer membrane protein beta-barrel domain-containing protein n=1 Tax=Lutibacter oricola TaxID=762486 RepID=A0A1H3DAL7_9FLAO|nr:outer membrane beta-barrel protein [Lutibacter oricola]SDX63483.1 Outer membrane protein beta-barrel domain-containing protein [Lutibacter oricola]